MSIFKNMPTGSAMEQNTSEALLRKSRSEALTAKAYGVIGVAYTAACGTIEYTVNHFPIAVSFAIPLAAATVFGSLATYHLHESGKFKKNAESV